MIDGELHVPPASGKPYDPIQFRRSGLIAGIAIRKHIDIAIQHDLVFVKIQVGVCDVPDECPAGVVGPREVIAVVEEPAGSGIDRQVLIRQ